MDPNRDNNDDDDNADPAQRDMSSIKKGHFIVSIIYLVGLIIWCVTASMMFWNSKYNEVACRTDTFTSHYYDFMLLDIVSGFIIIAKIFCGECWVGISNYLSKPQVVNSYGEYAKTHTAEWIKYHEPKTKK